MGSLVLLCSVNWSSAVLAGPIYWDFPAGQGLQWNASPALVVWCAPERSRSLRARWRLAAPQGHSGLLPHYIAPYAGACSNRARFMKHFLCFFLCLSNKIPSFLPETLTPMLQLLISLDWPGTSSNLATVYLQSDFIC